MKKMTFFWLLSATLVACGVAGCKKSASKPKPSWTPGSDIYMVGGDSGRAVYWKNGDKTVLTPGEGEGIAVSGSSVYVGGVSYRSVGSTTADLAAFWKDGVEEDLTNSGIAWAYQPVVVGADVYVPGYIFGPTPQVYPVYWKNGQRVNLDPSLQGIATGMAVSDTDVYVIGSVYDGQFDTALVWKNGQRMPGFFSIETNPFNQIMVSGGNVYVVGLQGYYINFNQYVQLKGASQGISTISMYLDGSDIYVAGATDTASSRYAAYWKNGVMVALSNYPGTTSSAATGVVVAGSDVYVAGSGIVNGVYLGMYWKNGVEETLTKNGDVNGILLGN